MFLLGVVRRPAVHEPADHADLDFFPFPAINPKWGQDSIDAPIDGFMISKKPKNSSGAKKLLDVPRHRAGGEHLPRDRPERRRRRTSTRTRAHYTAAAEEGGRR